MMRPLGFLFVFTLSLLTACAAQTSQSAQDMNKSDADELILKSIVVLQSESDPVDQDKRSAEALNLEEGCRVLSSIIAEYFAMKENVNILSPMQQESLTGTFIGNLHKRARYIGMQAQGDAVLITHLIDYRKLEGKKYGANEPASVSFDYSLIHLESGKTLCKGSFEETQKTLLSDLLSFGKASKRNFEFVSAETLLREGVERKFGDCRYLTTTP
ncbi:MAG: hypothetical protein KKD73_02045 [Proteobacteria bacterium]|nr:hypothetical protein [Pseudomonadota bacterium]MBU1640248.1 hypothetical protein [Pseudomonadota bacterium]